MHSSPITTWEGAAAYYTFANDPNMISIILAVAIVATIGAIVFGAMHEKECYVKVEKNGH